MIDRDNKPGQSEFDHLRNSLGDLTKVLKHKQELLDAIMELVRAINSDSQSMEQEFATGVLYILNKNLKYKFNAKRYVLWYRDKNDLWNCWAEGTDEKIKRLDPEKDLPLEELMTDIDPELHPKLKEFASCFPFKHKGQLIGVLLIDSVKTDGHRKVYNEDRSNSVQSLTNIALMAMQNRKLQERQMKHMALEREMMFGEQMQRMLITDDLPDNEVIKIAAEYLPNRNVGGDYYDYQYLDIEEKHVFSISDISGKGIAAALLMANFQANLKTLVNKNYPLSQLVEHLNHKVKEVTNGDKFITFFIGEYDPAKRKLRFVNAGHNPPVLVNDGKIELLKDGCTILGIFDDLPSIQVGEVYVEDNAFLCCYTDGIIDLENMEGEFYETERLEAFISAHHSSDIEVFNKKLIAELEKFKGEKDYVDDVTLMSCRFW